MTCRVENRPKGWKLAVACLEIAPHLFGLDEEPEGGPARPCVSAVLELLSVVRQLSKQLSDRALDKWKDP